MNYNMLLEVKVTSSWIDDISVIFSKKEKTATFTTKAGATYKVMNLSNNDYESWLMAESKGKFFHKFIKNQYDIVRV